MGDDQELAILAEIEEEGYQDAIAGDNFTQAPYKHGSKEWNAWRGGWARGYELLHRCSRVST